MIKRFALPLFLLMFGVVSHAQSTVKLDVTGSEHTCNNVAYCIYTLSAQGTDQAGTFWLYGANWTQFGVVQTLFCSPNVLNTSPYNPTANPIAATCSGMSQFDNTPYALTLSATYKKVSCGRGGCWYAITGGTATLTASDETLHQLGVEGY